MSETADLFYFVERTGLTITRPISSEEWAAIGHDLVNRSSGMQWALGDWIIGGGGMAWAKPKVKKQQRAPNGHSIYERAADITGLSLDYIAEMARTAEAFPKAERKPLVPWAHYRTIRSAPAEQVAGLVDGVGRYKWTIPQLRERVAKANEAAGKTKPTGGSRPGPEVTCPQCSHHFPVKGHLIDRRTRG
jgi:hypothetical protein